MNAHSLRRRWVFGALCIGIGALLNSSLRALEAGAYATDVTPRSLPVIRNGGFTEATVDRVDDALHARAFVLRDESEVLAIVVVDSCMIPRTVCDATKELIVEHIGIPSDRILISATHTHSAPSVMNYCLGSRMDPAYAAWLPDRIAEAVSKAHERLAPARIGWTRFDAGAFTSNRRWVTWPENRRLDPFGERTVQANMHPGYQNPDWLGESGPKDPWFSLVSIQGADGEPLAVLGNFSMHYFSGHPGISSDYFGRFSAELARRIAPENTDFVAALSQGTSGDLWRADYSAEKPAEDVTIQDYTEALVERSMTALESVDYRLEAPLGMEEIRVTLARRTPDEERLAWAREILDEMGDRRPETRPEVYAEQAVYLSENPEEEVVAQALRIGELGITAMPNEVYALTGLKLKARSPMEMTINVSLANGAAGYIPPPEQHFLGGYNTWPARTAGLAVSAEPILVREVLNLLESVSGRPARDSEEAVGRYVEATLDLGPRKILRMGEMQAPDSYEPGVALYLPGVEGEGFPKQYQSRSAFFVGGRRVESIDEIGDQFSVSMWIRNSLPRDKRDIVGFFISRTDGQGAEERIGIGGREYGAGRLIVESTHSDMRRLVGNVELNRNEWNHVCWVRDGELLRVYLNGRLEIEEVGFGSGVEGSRWIIGGHEEKRYTFLGRIDEVALFDRALSGEEARGLFDAAGVPARSIPPEPLPTPKESALETIRVSGAMDVELVASEPVVMDPVAIDWGLDGSLWVAEMSDYPSGPLGGNDPGGRVVRLFDTDDDGVYDRREVLLESVSFPTGVMSWRDGVLVTTAPEIIYLEDTDGDGRADIRDVWFSGFIEGNQQLRVNGLRWGMDGWIYCASGGHHSGFGTSTVIRSHKTGKEIELGSRDFRFREDGSFEALAGPSQFGRVRDDFGNWFGVQNSRPIWHYAIPDVYANSNPYVASPDPRRLLREQMARLYPAKAPQKRFHGFDHVGRYTSACGISIYRDRVLFPHTGITYAFTCAPFHNLVQRSELVPNGSTFEGRRAPDGSVDFFASTDRWSRPVMSRTGPDGALWVVDMYRYMIEHPDWLPDDGKAALRPYYRAGDSRGRIYRVFANGQRSEMPNLADLPDRRLAAALADSNGIIRDLAQRYLNNFSEIGTESFEVVGALVDIARSGLDARARVQALETLRNKGVLSRNLVLEALNASDPQVRKAAIRLGAFEFGALAEFQTLVNDPSDLVRTQLAFSMGAVGVPIAGEMLQGVARLENADPLFTDAVIGAAGRHYEALNIREVASSETQDQLARMAARRPEFGDALWADLSLESERRGVSQDLRWLNLWQDEARVAGSSPWDDARREAVVGFARSIAADTARSLADRASAVTLLSGELDELRVYSDARVAPALRAAAIEALSHSQGIDAVQLAITIGRNGTPRDQALIRSALVSRSDWLSAAFDAIEDQQLPRSIFGDELREAGERSSSEEIQGKVARLFASVGVEGEGLALEDYEGALRLDGDATRGGGLYAARCASCHEPQEEMGRIGPDLRGVSQRSKAAILEAVLFPNRSVDPEYVAYDLALNSGSRVYGRIGAETGNALVVYTLDGARNSILRSDLASVTSSGRSLMPEGLLLGLSNAEVADLLAFVEMSIEGQTQEE